MDFSFSEDQLARRQRIIEFAQTHLGADLQARDRGCIFARDDWDRCGAQGIIGSHVKGLTSAVIPLVG